MKPRVPAERIAAARGALYLGQHDNRAKPRAHDQTTADELWRDHLVYLDELMLGTMFCSQGHRTAVAEYQFHCLDAYRRYEREVIDRFLPRLLKVSATEDAAATDAAEGSLVGDLHEILA